MTSAIGLFSRRLIQLPGIELEDTADERRRIAPSHVRGGLAKLVGDRLARVSTGCAPSLQSGFEFEQVCGNSRIHEGTSEDEITISEASIESASRAVTPAHRKGSEILALMVAAPVIYMVIREQMIDCRRQHPYSNIFMETPMKPSQKINRRSFINQATTLVVGSGAFSASASSYNRILGANDRISLGHIGVGRRGKELAWIVAKLKEKNVEMTAVCDLWKINREAAAAQATKDYGRAPRAFQYMEELLALRDVDAVLVSTADFQTRDPSQTRGRGGQRLLLRKTDGQ